MTDAKRRRVLLFSCEPGGAEVIAPLVELLQGNGYDVELTAYGHAADRFQGRGLRNREIGPIAINDMSLLNDIKPDLVISSATSLPDFDMSEKNLWCNAKAYGIPTIAFIDQWQNYAQRFSGTKPEDRLKFQPDFINCINEIGREEAAADGLDRCRLRTFGHPSLSELTGKFARMNGGDLCERIGADPARERALFVSEPIRKYFGDSRGYDQHDALSVFLEHMMTRVARPSVVIKLHPKDDLAKYRVILDKYSELDPIVVWDQLSGLECVAISDGVFGMTSILLVEAYLAGKPVASIQPRLEGVDPLVLSRHGMIPLIKDPGGMKLNVASAGQMPTAGCEFDVAFKEGEFIRFVDELMRDWVMTTTKC